MSKTSLKLNLQSNKTENQVQLAKVEQKLAMLISDKYTKKN